jgi:hypothetical protein
MAKWLRNTFPLAPRERPAKQKKRSTRGRLRSERLKNERVLVLLLPRAVVHLRKRFSEVHPVGYQSAKTKNYCFNYSPERGPRVNAPACSRAFVRFR